MSTIENFARKMVETDRKACALAGTEMDDVWAGEHTTALTEHLGRKPTEDEIDAAARAYAEAAEHAEYTHDPAADLAWAASADDGDYLVEYEETGLSTEEDPGSRCGRSDRELDEIRKVLHSRDLRLVADDRGLVAQSVEQS